MPARTVTTGAEQRAPTEASAAGAHVSPAGEPASGRGVPWRRIGGALAVAGLAAGRVAARAGAQVGSAVSAAYHAVDPDVRRQIGELPLVGLTMLAPGRREVVPLADDGRNVVVFVHGLGGGPGNFWPMGLYFRLHGRSRSYAVALPAGRPIVELAEVLSTFLEDLARANDLPEGRRVDIVAHSMGGLVARAALERSEISARVATLITLGTPHEGTHLARLAVSTSLLELRRSSDLVERLREQLPWKGPPERPRLVAFWSAADTVLLPHTTGRVDGADSVEIEGASHYGYLLQPAIWAKVLSAL
ncbi:MAG: alpha/beta fold hydrolase [Deltaproteobacteria bacterium]|nr:alpha/beta fold hydrolase [Deltaproteobacteria bacterium]